MKRLYTMVFRRSAGKWVALCLENGVVGQGESKEDAMRKLQEAIASLGSARATEEEVYSAPISIGELHEFLTYGADRPTEERYELCAVYA